MCENATLLPICFVIKRSPDKYKGHLLRVSRHSIQQGYPILINNQLSMTIGSFFIFFLFFCLLETTIIGSSDQKNAFEKYPLYLSHDHYLKKFLAKVDEGAKLSNNMKLS